MEEIINQIISLSKSNRIELAHAVRTNQDVWNAVHGFGDASPILESGLIEGLVIREAKLEADVLVKAIRIDEFVELASPIEAIEAVEAIEQIEKVIIEERVLTSEIEGETYEAITDSSGAYQLELPVGIYEITYTKVGVASVVMENVSSITESTSTINVELV